MADIDYWFKIVAMLQQNWAVIEKRSGRSVRILFIADDGQIFDDLVAASVNAARRALAQNGFCRLADDAEARTMLAPPIPPFSANGKARRPIYSSGAFWIASD